jgi:hypothetical protein
MTAEIFFGAVGGHRPPLQKEDQLRDISSRKTNGRMPPCR